MKIWHIFVIWVVLMAIIVSLVMALVVGGINYIHNKGLKNITTEIWEGKARE